jgi:hypothetical protein
VRSHHGSERERKFVQITEVLDVILVIQLFCSSGAILKSDPCCALTMYTTCRRSQYMYISNNLTRLPTMHFSILLLSTLATTSPASRRIGRLRLRSRRSVSQQPRPQRRMLLREVIRCLVAVRWLETMEWSFRLYKATTEFGSDTIRILRSASSCLD